MQKTEQEQIRHSEELEKSDGAIWGQGPTTGYEIDLAFRDNGSGMRSWAEGTDFFRDWLESKGWDNHSAGTGFGLRDMQFGRQEPLTETEFQKLVEEAKSQEIMLDYCNQHGVNEWGEQVKEDAPHTYKYEQEQKHV